MKMYPLSSYQGRELTKYYYKYVMTLNQIEESTLDLLHKLN